MAILYSAVKGCLGRTRIICTNPSTGSRIWRSFQLTQDRSITLRVIVFTTEPRSNLLLNPDFLHFAIVDFSGKNRQKRWVFVNITEAIQALGQHSPMLSVEDFAERFFGLTKIRESIVHNVSHQSLLRALTHFPIGRSSRLQANFTIQQGRALLKYVLKEISRWGNEGDEGWQKNGSVQFKRIKSKDVPELPRTLIIVRLFARVIGVFVLFNQSFPKGAEERRYEGMLGRGGDNVVKIALELFSGKYYAVRSSQPRARAYERAVSEEELTQKLPEECVLPSIIAGTYEGRDGILRYMTIKDLCMRDVRIFVPVEPLQRIVLAMHLVFIIIKIHRCGVIHGDIKHDAFRYTPDGEEVRLTDFGRARLCDSQKPIRRFGTPEYMYPGLTTALFLDDRWGLAMILWSLFGVTFQRQDGTEIPFMKYFNVVRRFRSQFFSSELSNFDGYLESIKNWIGDNWIQEPLEENVIEHLVWSMLRIDVPSEEDPSYINRHIWPRLTALYEIEKTSSDLSRSGSSGAGDGAAGVNG